MESGTKGMKFVLPGHPFTQSCKRKSSLIGKMFIIRLIEDMYSHGYDLMLTTNLNTAGERSTLFFRRVCGPDQRRPSLYQVLCISPSNKFKMGGRGTKDRMNLIQCPEVVVQAVKQAVTANPKFWIMEETKSTAFQGEEVVDFKLNSQIWDINYRAKSDLLISLIQNVEATGWKLLAAINLKGLSDSLFFLRVLTPETMSESGLLSPPSQLAFLQLHGGLFCQQEMEFTNVNDIQTMFHVARNLHALRNRIMGCKEPGRVEDVVSYKYDVCQGFDDYLSQKQVNLNYDAPSFGHSSDFEEFCARSLLCNVFSSLNVMGWEIRTSMNMVREVPHLGGVVFARCRPASFQYACLSLTDSNKLKIIGFSPEEVVVLKTVLYQAYAPGIIDESTSTWCHQITLNGEPWQKSPGHIEKIMLMYVLMKAEKLGWRVMTSLSSSSNTRSVVIRYSQHYERTVFYRKDADSWFLRKLVEIT